MTSQEQELLTRVARAMGADRYKIVPGRYCRFVLLRWLHVPFLPFIGFWDHVSSEDDYHDLAERVRLCGGRLVGAPLSKGEE